MTSHANSDGFNLQRFVEAQAGVYEIACAELKAGRKASHWMWFIFPQMRGLGASPTAHFYGISSLAEARAYLAHPVLGARLNHITTIALAIKGSSVRKIFGSPDDMKFHSSMTLFAVAAGTGSPYQAALDRYFGGKQDAATMQLIG